MPRLGPPLRDYVPLVAIAELDDPEAIGPHYDALRREAETAEADERRSQAQRAAVEQCIRNHDRGGDSPRDRGKLGSEV